MAGRPRIIVGISGGVDSAVAALCLLREGFDVEALHMTNWDEADTYCTAAADFQAARAVCTELGIPLHRANFAQAYREEVFAAFLRDYAEGRTPNPDVLCNRMIKFGHFYAHARKLGADLVATGHYARLSGDPPRLCRAVDEDKDQTYFLHAVDPRVLPCVRFPLGGLTKPEVRALAAAAGLPNHERPDSTGICFIGERPFREFLSRYLTGSPGPIETPAGEVVGRHGGLLHYTVGQRSGLRIGGRRSGDGEAWYVAGRDAARNALIVVQGRADPHLWTRSLRTRDMRWLRDPGYPPGAAFACTARLRHRHRPAACRATPVGDGRWDIGFAEPQWAAAPGQYAVLYADDECLGGGVIEQPVTVAETGRDPAVACSA